MSRAATVAMTAPTMTMTRSARAAMETGATLGMTTCCRANSAKENNDHEHEDQANHCTGSDAQSIAN